ncbi:hypothetical protein C1J00_41495 [Streptomyces cahuitamycinicus]|uniref:Uncharacterized protein n=2 Tax=Streptomyces cahuitamycinicus TaxID=2070367 RepID=A0A2N8TBY8_9ACTN|nr:hypothetical protein C1J00_41495 [Streptomyces cahuitamycinicus]
MTVRSYEEVTMLKQLESMGSRLLGLFVPGVDASAAQCWSACWQCNNDHGGPCNCNAPCCYGQGHYSCNCNTCP